MKYNKREKERGDTMKNNKIREYREKQGLTQQELGERVGKSQIAISLYESGDRTPSVRIGQLIAEALGTTMDNLFMP